ncbi:Hypothetical protein SRAE_2000073000 [Strongyloides ratti]|uniref:Uncharacterized protein n=1 Tax=Strongyloides ratti TaxID=34506 RepID=A0A090LEV1_STRRB|nr:Hypothetical protein SRAE_2000073000 [Strongyloides ratti]CEF66060.1 Hypothetical protein SRAE_2000073000 [Strongyloides ratti]
MKVFLLFILLIIFILKVVINEHVTIRYHEYKYTTFKYPPWISKNIKLHELEDLKINETKFENIHFKNHKVIYIEWEEIQKPLFYPNRTYGLMIFNEDLNDFHGFFFHKNLRSFHFVDFKIHGLFLNVHKCNIGYLFFDKEINYEKINHNKNIYTVEYAVLIIIKSLSNIIVLNEINYHETNIKISLCPYINWITNNGPTKYIPDDYIINDGFKDPFSEDAYIITPVFKKNPKLSFFSCGKLKQPTLNYISVGYNLIDDENERKYVKEIDPLHDDIICNNGNDKNNYLIYSFSKTSTNDMIKNRMERIIISSSKIYKLYAGQTIFLYKKFGFEEYDPEWEYKDIKCVLKLKNNINATILPTLGSINLVKYNPYNEIFYQFIQKEDFEMIKEFKCLSKVEGEYKNNLDEFYSKAVEFTVIKIDNQENILKNTSNEIIFYKYKMDNFGSYICKDSRSKELYDKKILTFKKVYFIPGNDTEINLIEGIVQKNRDSYAGCQQSYESFSNITEIKVNFIENNKNFTIIGNILNLPYSIEIEDNQVIFKDYDNISDVKIECTYKTILNTTFVTKQNFKLSKREYSKIMSNVIGDSTFRNFVISSSNPLSWMLTFIVIVTFFFIVFVITLLRMNKKRKKIEEKKDINKSSNYSMDSFTSSSSSTNGTFVSQLFRFNNRKFLRKKKGTMNNEKNITQLPTLSTTIKSESLSSVSSSVKENKKKKYFTNDDTFKIITN